MSNSKMPGIKDWSSAKVSEIKIFHHQKQGEIQKEIEHVGELIIGLITTELHIF